MAVVKYGNWEMLVSEAVVNDPVKHAAVVEVLRLISEVAK